MSPQAQTGHKRIQEILGPQSTQIVEMLSAISPDFGRYILEIGYGEFYTRPGISDKTREIAAVACLVGQGSTGLPLKAHLRGMLNVGHTQNDVLEVLLFLIPYVGIPPIVNAMLTVDAVFKEVQN